MGSLTLPTPASREEPLEIAGKTIDHWLQSDNLYPRLIDLLHVSPQHVPTISGLQDADYPISPNMPGFGETFSQLNVIQTIPLPAELLEQFEHMQCNCMMGLFPEIGRAWLTIDSDIFVWTYDNVGDFVYFNGLSETILSVGLVKPKSGIFRKHIHFLLCLTTTVEIVLLGISFNVPDDGTPIRYIENEMHILPEPLFFLSTDNNYILQIASTTDGRIFMGGKDGCLYELAYQAEDGWFSRKCRRINHSSSALSFMVPSFLNFAFSEEDPLVQISIDNTRHILYTRSEKGTIQVFDLGGDGKSTCKVVSLSQNTIIQFAVQVARTIDRSNFKSLVHIAAVEGTESTHVHLVVITQGGVRLYFTTTPLNNPTQRPTTLELLHVRLPPGFAANAPAQRPNKVHMAHYRKGVTILLSSHSEDNDVFWTMSRDIFPFNQQLMEIQSVSPIDGKAWALAEIPTSKFLFPSYQMGNLAEEPPLAVTQHMEIPRKFVLLTPKGSHIITHLRPVDQLRQLLLDNNGPDNEIVKRFFTFNRREDNACATCLVLACSKVASDMQVAEWAARAFFLYGGEPHIHYPTAGSSNLPPGLQANVFGGGPVTPSQWPSSSAANIGSASPAPSNIGIASPASSVPGFQPPQTSTPHPSFPYSHSTSALHSPGFQGHSPGPHQTTVGPNMSGHLSQSTIFPSNIQSTQQGQFASSYGPEILFSGKHNGLYLYFSRIIRPVWENKLIRDMPMQTPQGHIQYITLIATSDELGWYQEQLLTLKGFMEKYIRVKSPITSDSSSQNLPQRVLNFLKPDNLSSSDVSQIHQQLQKKSQVEAQLHEKTSLINLQHLICRTSEVLGLLKVLVDHQFHSIAEKISKECQSQLRAMTFRDFVVSGQDIANLLVTALINRYLGDNATTDAISSRLREVCPSIYKTEDAVSAKVVEMLLNARQIQNRYEKDQVLQEALKLAKQITPQLNIPVICAHFQAVHCYEAIVELALTAAARRDPQGIALQYYKKREPAEDHQGFHAYCNRLESYKVILEILGQLLNISLSHPKSPSVPKRPGPPPVPDPNLLNPNEAGEHFERMFNLAVKSDDELFHVSLYNWLLEKKLVERLLEVRTVYLENYLKNSAEMHPESLQMMDLLWKYYEKSGNYGAASRILSKLSEKHGTDINLQQRIEYISRAAMCIKSSEIRNTLGNEGEFLHELEEKMEVALIQLQILEALEKSVPLTQNIKESISCLNSDLLDITQLYENFADLFNLYECKLAIINCANHYDPTLVEALWQNILDKEFSLVDSASPETVVATVSNKIITLGRVYSSSQKYFPLPFLIKYLERRSAQLELDHSWVFTSLQRVGVTLPRLLDFYDKFYKSKDPIWHTIRKPLHLLWVLCELLNTFADMPSLVSHQERRQFANVALDHIAGYLIDLQSLSSHDDSSVQSLTAKFKAVQSKLDRFG